MIVRVLRGTTELAIAVALIAVLCWCFFLFWGAYSQHRIAILLDRQAVAEMSAAIKQATSASPGGPAVSTGEALDKLRQAQEELYDKNTVSFLFQFLTLLLFTVGTAILAVIYRAYKAASGAANEATRELDKIRTHLALCLRGRNNTTLLAVKCMWVHTLGRLYSLSCGPAQEELRIILSDLYSDITKHLEEAWANGEGLEERLFLEVVLDGVTWSESDLRRLRDQATEGIERSALSVVQESSAEILNRLGEQGAELIKRSETQWKAIMGRVSGEASQDSRTDLRLA